MATAEVLLYKGGAGAGPRVERSELKHGGGGAVPHTRQCIHKVATVKVLLFEGDAGASPRVD